MLTPQLLATLDDDHLVAALHAEFDPLTSTPAELELLKRLERLLDEQGKVQGLKGITDDYSVTDEEIRSVIECHPASLKTVAELLALLNDEDIHETEQLKALIARANEFEAIAKDAGDVLGRLHQLITTVQE